ncbi:MAG: hypothetical protein J7M34_05410 [Anaerolineae bacterium]|nr:hypothetical protein [Anaerolineae bacterium]
MITGAELIVGGLILTAILVYPLRRYLLISALIGAIAGGALILISTRWPLDRVVPVWGRVVLLGRPLVGLGFTWRITNASRSLLTVLGSIATVAFIGAGLNPPGRAFVPIGLVILALWVTAMIVSPLAGAFVALVAVSCLSVFLIQTGQRHTTRAAFRQLWWPLIAFALVTIAAWHIQEASFHPNDLSHLRTAAWLTGTALLLLLAPLPFHVPATSLLTDASPVVGAFLLTGTQVVTLYLTWTAFAKWPWLSQYIEAGRALSIAGLATLLWGAVEAATANRIQRLWAYAALYDWGVFLLGFSLGAPLEWRMATALFIARTLSLFLEAYGITILQARGTGDDWHGTEGILHRLPWVTLAIVVGGLGLAGFPLTASFGPRWALTQTLLSTRPVWGLLVVAGQLGVALGYLRLIQSATAPLPTEHRLVPRESTLEAALLVVGVAISGIIALAPQTLNGVVRAVISIVVQSPGRMP